MGYNPGTLSYGVILLHIYILGLTPKFSDKGGLTSFRSSTLVNLLTFMLMILLKRHLPDQALDLNRGQETDFPWLHPERAPGVLKWFCDKFEINY